MSDEKGSFIAESLKDNLSFDIIDSDISEKEVYIREFVTLNYYTATDNNLKPKRAFHFAVILISRMLFNRDIELPDTLNGLDFYQFQKSVTKQLTNQEQDIYELYLCLNNAKYHICQYHSLFDTVKSFNGLEKFIDKIYKNYYVDLPYIQKRNLFSALVVTFITQPKDLIELLNIASVDIVDSYEDLLTKFIYEYNDYMKSHYV